MHDEAAAPPLCGLVLCGGAGRRMGTDKALILVDGERLVDRAVRRLGAVADPILLATGRRHIEVAGCLSVPDPATAAGPLAGILAGLRRSPHELTAVAAVDMPWIDADLLAAMARSWSGEDAVIASGPNGPEMLHAVYARAAVPALEAALAADRLRVRDLLSSLRLRVVDAVGVIGPERAARFGTNLNSPEDLASLLPGPAAAS